MARGVADADRPRPAVDCSRVQALDRFRIAAAGVLGDVHDIEPEGNGIFDGLLGRLYQKIISPAFGETSNRTRSNKCRGLDPQSGLLHDLSNGPNVIFM